MQTDKSEKTKAPILPETKKQQRLLRTNQPTPLILDAAITLSKKTRIPAAK
ncbi:MAG: hypothetical protein KAI61_05990 [Alphaproteobacteria bacterium]|nr:hypothetical protein [Alphaproteobacteria bacterium]MCK5659702.1 hypothetical protein [Alphaproteobacteria bacterium]